MYKTGIERVCKKSSNIFYWVKNRLVWVFENRREQEQGDNNETGLKEGGVIEIKTTVLFSLLDARSILLIYVPLICFCVTIGVM